MLVKWPVPGGRLYYLEVQGTSDLNPSKEYYLPVGPMQSPMSILSMALVSAILGSSYLHVGATISEVDPMVP